MSKKLRSAVNKEELDKLFGDLPKATPNTEDHEFKKPAIEEKPIPKTEIIVKKPVKQKTIAALVSPEFKIEIAKYLAEHPEESERSLILKGLRNLGFGINEEELVDKRTRK